MKEIVYVQAGSLANYIGTHFWNTQEAYFTYEEEGSAEESFVSHDISFREGLSSSGQPTYSPRLLIFDRKANFGALGPTNDLYAEDEVDGEGPSTLWNGDVVEYRQEQISKSQYQEQLDNESVDDADQSGANESHDIEGLRTVRYWSDYSRVYYHPRTVQPLPDTVDWQDVEGDWNYGQEEFLQYDQDRSLMDDAFRHFLEECDALQGIQIMNDTSTFGSFVDALIVFLRDDHPKLPFLTFPLLSTSIPRNIVDDLGTRKAINEALCLRSLRSLSSMSVPVQPPSTWFQNTFPDLNLAIDQPYHTSAVLSSHIESVTLPLRMRRHQVDMREYCDSLAYPASTPFAHLSGILPLADHLESTAIFDDRIYDFSKISSNPQHPAIYTRRDSTRGFSKEDVHIYNSWKESSTIPDALNLSTHAPSLPLPTSFPRFFTSPLNTSSTILRNTGILAPRSVRIFSSLYSTSHTSKLFSAYATFVDESIRRKKDFAGMFGMEVDEVRDLANELWTMHDDYHGEDEIGGIDDDDSDGNED